MRKLQFKKYSRAKEFSSKDSLLAHYKMYQVMKNSLPNKYISFLDMENIVRSWKRAIIFGFRSDKERAIIPFISLNLKSYFVSIEEKAYKHSLKTLVKTSLRS